MKKCIRRWGSKLVFSEQGIALCRGIFGRQCKFLRWDEVAAVGYYVGSDMNVAYNLGAASVCPQAQQLAKEYNAPDLFVYFSVTAPTGFGDDDVIPIFRDGRNICFNLGGSEAGDAGNIKKIAEKTSELIEEFYGGKIINRRAVWHG